MLLRDTNALQIKHTPESIFRFDLRSGVTPTCKVGQVESTYVTMRDGVKLALDVVLPLDENSGTKRDTILVMTRYWRGIKGTISNQYADLLTPHGYAVVVGDV